MKINLIPISQEALETIEIDAGEFILGRMEEPLLSAPKEISSYVSRRHARIFYNEEKFCIVDLGSQNGTKVNGHLITEQAVVLKQGDEIEISADLRFRVEIINPAFDATILIPQENIELILEPVDSQTGLNILVVTAFPFLISKEAGVFPSFQKDYPDEINRISRRHAYISFEEGNFILTDMESTNGTLVNNDKLDKQGKILQAGDVVSFGGSFFSYIVKLRLPSREKRKDATVGRNNSNESEPVSEQMHEPRTTYVNDPNPFLDILCDEGNAATNEKSEPALHKGVDNEPISTSQSSSFIGKKILFLRQIFSAFSGHKAPIKKKLSTYLSSILLLAVAAGTLIFWLNKSDDIGVLIKRGEFSEAAEQSMQMLSESPEDAALIKLSTKAVLNSLVPKWQIDLGNSDFLSARVLITDAQSKYTGNSDLEKALPLMQWINQLYQFMSTRTEDTKIIIFQNEDQLSALMTSWNQNKKRNELTLGLIDRNVPGFNAMHDQTLGFIRILEHDQDIYIHAISVLKSSLLKKLQNDQTDDLLQEVVRFEKKYSAISGFEGLVLDIHNYIELNDALKLKDIELLNKMPREVLFQTPLFKRFSQQTTRLKRPTEVFRNQYYDAIRLWQTGDIENAIKILKALSNDSWSKAAKKKLSRYQLIIESYNALAESRKTNKYLGNLFNFHTLLQSPEDSYFLNNIENEFQKNKSQAIKIIQKHIDAAQVSWQKYIDNGGIGGLLRLENYISKLYQKQTQLLASANNDITYARHLYTALRMPDNKKWNRVSSEITGEIVKQTKWLGDLELVIKPSVLKQKLDLMKVNEEL